MAIFFYWNTPKDLCVMWLSTHLLQQNLTLFPLRLLGHKLHCHSLWHHVLVLYQIGDYNIPSTMQEKT